MSAGLDGAVFFSSASLAKRSFSIAAFLAAACANAALEATAADADADDAGAGAADAAATAALAELAATALVGSATPGRADAARSGAEAAATGALAAPAMANDTSAAGLLEKNLTPTAAQASATTPAMAQTRRRDGLVAAIGAGGICFSDRRWVGKGDSVGACGAFGGDVSVFVSVAVNFGGATGVFIGWTGLSVLSVIAVVPQPDGP